MDKNGLEAYKIVEVKGLFDENLMKPYFRSHFKSSVKFFLVAFMFFATAGILLLTFGKYLDLRYIGYGFAFSLLILSAFFLIVIIILVCSVDSAVKSYKLLSPNTMQYFRFEQHGFLEITTKQNEYKSHTECSYSLLHSAVMTNAYFILNLSNSMALVVCKNNIITGSSEELAYILSSNLGAKFKTMRTK